MLALVQIKKRLKTWYAEWLDWRRVRNSMINLSDWSRARFIMPMENHTEKVNEFIAYIEKSGIYEIEYIGNWWIEGNTYKGLNFTLNPIGKPRWKFKLLKYLWSIGIPTFGLRLPIKTEIQIHTEQSSALAEQNHELYKILRDESQPLEDRQEAFDKMVSSFAMVTVPDNIESIGQPVSVSRPEPEPSPEEIISSLFEEILNTTGLKVETIKPEYPPRMQQLLDHARSTYRHQPNTAILYFEQVVEEFDSSTDLWVCRGVATALSNSGEVMMYLGEYDKAINYFNRAIEKAGSDPDLKLESDNAAERIKEALKLKDEATQLNNSSN